ncbi:unnamed protein product, partial [Porites evermanni]
MADVNRRASLLACYLLILSILRRRRARTIPRRHRFWVRQIYQKREELGAYHTLVQELRLHDREFFFRFTRMSPERFEYLLTLVGPFIAKKPCWSCQFCT